ncbi:uncharacterized protein [Neodiprion pinetum]|uniref:uncharacterized protein n=1 Tax=Neodiprion pinetum TaxID=441929 RepID=UPI001EDFACA1|nr:proline-rich transmembrane protein 4 [Neodiprion pinetum]
MIGMSTHLLLWLSTLSCATLVRGTGEGGPNSPVYNLDETPLEKNLAAIFNKVSHGSATTKRSVPVYEAQMSASTTLSTVPAPLSTTPTSPSMRYPIPRATMAPGFRELPSYAPPARAFFTPPLPPEYLNPFADKPTLRGTNTDSHSGVRRPVPPPSLTPAHERIPIRPPDLVVGSSSQSPEKPPSSRNKPLNTPSREQQKGAEAGVDSDRKNVTASEFVPTLHFPSISRILSGSNGRKQDIPDILLRPLSTKPPPFHNVPPASTTEGPSTTSTQRTITKVSDTVTYPTIFNLPNTRRQEEEDNGDHNLKDENGDAHGIRTEHIGIVGAERLPRPQAQPPDSSKRPPDNNGVINHVDSHPLESTWRIAWSLHVYVAAIMFTLMALYSIYKIVRFNEATNLLSQSYFLTLHLLLTTVCTLRCFHLFYDPYNRGHSLSKPLSGVLMNLPAPLLTTAFATLVLYLARCSQAPSLNNKFVSPAALVLCSAVHVVLCVSLHVSAHVLGYSNADDILPLVCQCIYIVVCVTLGLCYMYVYRVARSQIQITNAKSVGNHVGADPTTVALSTAITTTIATAMLSILMGFVQLYEIFGVQERIDDPYPWLRWGWEFSVRLLELSMCGLLVWVGSLSQYPLREKQLQQHSAHSGFALFPCGSSTSTENMDDVLYPAICSTNQAIQNYNIRTGKQIYDDSFPLNTLPEHLNISGTFERHSIRKSGTMGHFPHEARSSLNRHGNGVQTLKTSSDVRGRHTPIQNLHEQQPPTSGSTMLVAEDGFVRFRSLGAEEDELSDSQSIVGTHGRGSSLAGSVRYNARHPGIQHQHQHSHSSHQGHHQSHHQLYNNT